MKQKSCDSFQNEWETIRWNYNSAVIDQFQQV